MATLSGTDLGHIRREQNGKSTNLFIQALPASDSDDTLVLDLFGVTRKITIEATKTGVTATLQSFINTIEALIAGSQSTVVFVSSLHDTNKNVLVENFLWNYLGGSPNKLDYTLNLVEAST